MDARPSVSHHHHHHHHHHQQHHSHHPRHHRACTAHPSATAAYPLVSTSSSSPHSANPANRLHFHRPAALLWARRLRLSSISTAATATAAVAPNRRHPPTGHPCPPRHARRVPLLCRRRGRRHALGQQARRHRRRLRIDDLSDRRAAIPPIALAQRHHSPPPPLAAFFFLATCIPNSPSSSLANRDDGRGQWRQRPAGVRGIGIHKRGRDKHSLWSVPNPRTGGIATVATMRSSPLTRPRNHDPSLPCPAPPPTPVPSPLLTAVFVGANGYVTLLEAERGHRIRPPQSRAATDDISVPHTWYEPVSVVPLRTSHTAIVTSRA
ncbi:hypothetical protein DFJ73DRAFT_867113 [Zopfochytrium polystomum]|nr:hypothetical protein DFJ73DRAFT_867113 [Zopfochytrium polystomum]